MRSRIQGGEEDLLLRIATERLVNAVPGLDPGTGPGAVIAFFLYDSIKILAILFGLIALIGFARTYLPAEALKRRLGRHRAGYPAAALFGALTPFCSCSSVPIFIGFVRAGIPVGVGLAFLVTSPLINEYLVVLLVGSFGWKIATVYVAGGLVLGTAAGMLLGALRVERYLEKDLAQLPEDLSSTAFSGWKDRVRAGWAEAVSILGKLWPWVLAGVGIGALIHGYVPEGWIHETVGRAGIWSVPLATLLGVPVYASCAAIVPVAVVLFQKGMPLGAALAFVMAASALSLPEAVMLRRVMRLPLVAIFFGVTALGIVLIGFLFNWIA